MLSAVRKADAKVSKNLKKRCKKRDVKSVQLVSARKKKEEKRKGNERVILGKGN